MKKLLLMCSFAIMSLLAHSKDCIIQGRIIDLSNINKGIGHVKIKLRKGNLTAQVYSDADGKFLLPAPFIKNGDYVSLFIVKPGFVVPDMEEGSIMVNDQAIITIHMQLLREQTVQQNNFKTIALNNTGSVYQAKIRKLDSAILILKNSPLSSDKIKVKDLKDSIIFYINQINKYSHSINGISKEYTSRPIATRSEKNKKIYQEILNGHIDQAITSLNTGNDSAYIAHLNLTQQAFINETKNIYERARVAKLLLDYKTADKLYKIALRSDPLNINYILEYSVFLIFNQKVNAKTALPLLRTIPLNNIKEDSLKSTFYNTYGAAFDENGLRDSARYYYSKNLELNTQSKNFNYRQSMRGMALAYHNIGVTYTTIDDSTALIYFIKAQSTLNELKEKINYRYWNLESLTCYNIGIKYDARGEESIALKNYEKGAKLIYDQRFDDDINIKQYLDIQIAYNNTLFSLKPFKSILKSNAAFLDTIAVINKKYSNGLSAIESGYATTLAFNYWFLSDTAKAIYYDRYALNKLKPLLNDTDLNINEHVATLYYNLANRYRLTGDKRKASQYLDSAKTLYVRYGNLIDLKLPDGTDDFLLNKPAYYLNMANMYLSVQDTAKQKSMLIKASQLLANPDVNNKALWQKKIEVNNRLSNYYIFINRPYQAFKVDSQSLYIYKNIIKNNFTNELPVSKIYYSLANDLDYIFAANSKDPVYLNKILTYALKAVVPLTTSFAADSAYYAKELAEKQTYIGSVYSDLNKPNESNTYYKHALYQYSIIPEELTEDDYDNIRSINTALALRLDDDQLKYLLTNYAILKRPLLLKNSQLRKMKYLVNTLSQLGIYYQDKKPIPDSAGYYYRSALNILDTLKGRDVECLACWIVVRENALRKIKVDDKEKFRIQKQDVDIIENTLGIDSLTKHYGDNPNILSVTSNYLDVASYYFDTNKTDSAIIYSQKYINMLNTYKATDSVSIDFGNNCYNNLGYYYIIKGNYKKAIDLLQLCFTRYPVKKPNANITNLVFAYLFDQNYRQVKKILADFYKNHRSDMPTLIKVDLMGDFKDYQSRNFDKQSLSKFQEIISQYSDNPK